MERTTALRQKLRNIILDARLPKAELAEYVLGIDGVTIYRYLKGEKVPRSKATQLRSIQSIHRDGDMVYVALRVCAERPRWRMMEHTRKRNGAVS